jgi:CTP:molybdopterin cytidylyltransferase MocA
LSQLSGDDGAKGIIQQQKLINVENTEYLIDIDTPEDLQQIKPEETNE